MQSKRELALTEAIHKLDSEAGDISLPESLESLDDGRAAPIQVTWKSNDELHIGNFLAWTGHRDSIERRLLTALTETDLPIPEIISTGHADTLTIHLAHRVEGEPMSTELQNIGMRWQISAIAFAFARTLARIHSLDWATVAPWLGDPESLPEDIIDEQAEAEFARRTQLIEQIPDDWRSFIDSVVDWLDLRRPVEVSLCICHGNFRPENLIAVDEDITAIVGWSDACLTDASYDLAMLPIWLDEIGMSPEETELFGQAVHGAYLQSSPRALGNLPYYAVSRPLDTLLATLTDPAVSRTQPEVIKGQIERAMALGGKVPWKSR